jgi:hypothetical protein
MAILFSCPAREIGGVRKEQMSLLLPVIQMKMNSKEYKIIYIDL